MNRIRGGWVFVAVVIATLAVVGTALFVLVGHDGGSDTVADGTDDHAHHDPLSPHGAAPETVAVNAMTVMFSWQPGRDLSGWDAIARAHGQDLLTGTLADAAARQPNPLPQPVREWAAWQRSGDTVTAATTVTGEVDTDGDTATVPIAVAQTVLHRGGQSTPYTRYPATVTLQRDDTGTWRAANYRIGDTP